MLMWYIQVQRKYSTIAKYREHIFTTSKKQCIPLDKRKTMIFHIFFTKLQHFPITLYIFSINSRKNFQFTNNPSDFLRNICPQFQIYLKSFFITSQIIRLQRIEIYTYIFAIKICCFILKVPHREKIECQSQHMEERKTETLGLGSEK